MVTKDGATKVDGQPAYKEYWLEMRSLGTQEVGNLKNSNVFCLVIYLHCLHRLQSLVS